jgi:hypothetical protein
MRKSLLLLALVAAIGCKGADGAMGPPGPQGQTGATGPAGPAGALNRFEASGTVASTANVFIDLPAAAVAGGRVPAIACYISADRTTWLATAQLPALTTTPYCGMIGLGTATPRISLVSTPVNYYYYVIVVW